MTTLICPNCGTKTEFNAYIIPKREVISPKKMTFYVEGVPNEANLIPYDTTFFEVVSGKYKGNLVHTFDVKKI